MSLVSGLLFGAGLALGGMTDPGKVVAFLDVTGAWDPSLAFVMGSALLVTFPVFAWVRRSARPLFAERFQLPTRRDLDPQLLLGAALFGIGWGIAGLCPGPAIANLGAGSPEILLFVATMVAGMWLRDRTAAITG
ncbi:MAG: YeeE/YedE family protein [Gammaproteobacteria bacterium]|nr:YeeE/YedE family protein [Gammaproteobacteria bacterium]